LYDQFLHLGNCILTSVWHMVGNIRNLRPDHQAFFVTQIIEVLIVLIMCQADGVCPYFTDQLDIFFMMLRKQCVSDSRTVLMTCYAAQRIAFSVQEKSLFRVYMEGSAAETGAYAVKLFFAVHQLDFHRIQIRIFSSVPEMYVFHLKLCYGLSCVHRFGLRNRSILIL